LLAFIQVYLVPNARIYREYSNNRVG